MFRKMNYVAYTVLAFVLGCGMQVNASTDAVKKSAEQKKQQLIKEFNLKEMDASLEGTFRSIAAECGVKQELIFLQSEEEPLPGQHFTIIHAQTGQPIAAIIHRPFDAINKSVAMKIFSMYNACYYLNTQQNKFEEVAFDIEQKADAFACAQLLKKKSIELVIGYILDDVAGIIWQEQGNEAAYILAAAAIDQTREAGIALDALPAYPKKADAVTRAATFYKYFYTLLARYHTLVPEDKNMVRMLLETECFPTSCLFENGIEKFINKEAELVVIPEQKQEYIKILNANIKEFCRFNDLYADLWSDEEKQEFKDIIAILTKQPGVEKDAFKNACAIIGARRQTIRAELEDALNKN